MKVYNSNEVKNVVLIGGAKTGKTTLAECMLFESGLISRRGSIEDKNTVSDYRAIELERQNSVSSTVLYAEFNGKKINIIDAPGFDDYVGEVVSALTVCDTAIMLVNAQNGVEVGTEIHWRNTRRQSTPVIFAVNHLDHENSNFDETVRQLKTQFGKNLVICQYPVNPGIGYNALIDVLQMKMFKFVDGKTEILDIPESEKEKAEEHQLALMESAAESDEALMEIFFDKGILTEEEMVKGFLLGLTSRGLFPLFCIDAKHNYGVNRLMQFILNAVPSPQDMPGRKTNAGTELKCDPKAPMSLFIYKTAIEEHLGEMSFFKVYAGEVTEGMDISNGNNGQKERISQLFVVSGKKREKVEKIVAGDLGAAIKMKSAHTCDTLNSLKNPDIQIEPINFPAPKISMAVRAKNQADEEKLGTLLHEYNKVDKTFSANFSKELKQNIAQAQGELHLNTVKWLVEHINKIPIEYYAPKIPYRETITKQAKAMYRHKKQSGGSGQFGEVHMLIQPYFEGMKHPTEFPVRGVEEHILPWGGKLVYHNCIVGGAIDARFMPAIVKGLMEKMEEGPLTGSYARDIAVYVFDGKMHPVDSNEISFKLAGRNAFREAFKNAGPKILEPIYNVEVMVPEDKMGDIMTDLQGRRAVIMGMESDGNYQKIKAKVPLAEMYRYSTALSSITSGRATYGLKFADYAPVPPDVQANLLKVYEEQEKEEE
ncbi:MAG: elongation factor G [Bacteroidetes bacterium]|nr:elongation factor G [Bacteroidota bacterium]